MSMLLLLLFILLKGIWSHISDFVDPVPIMLGKPMKMKCSFAEMEQFNVHGWTFDNVIEIVIKRIRDDGALLPPPLYQFALYPEERVQINKTFAGRENQLSLKVEGRSTLETKSQRRHRQKYLGIQVTVHNVTCQDIGLVKFSFTGISYARQPPMTVEISQCYYLDTERHQPRILVNPPKGSFRIGTRVGLTCTVHATLKQVRLALFLSVNDYLYTLPTNASYVMAGGENFPKDPMRQTSKKIYGPCREVQYYQHSISIAFSLESEEIKRSFFICEATFVANGIKRGYASRERTIETLSLKHCVNSYCNGYPPNFKTSKIEQGPMKHDPNIGILIAILTLVLISVLALLCSTIVIERRERRHQAKMMVMKKKRNKKKRLNH